MKNQSGITMITLAVTIIVLLILSGIGITIGTNAIRTSQDSKLVSEVAMVQHAVLEQYSKYQTTKDSSYLIGNKLQLAEVNQYASELGITLVTIPSGYANQDYYRFDKASLLEIGIKNTDDEYVINYISGEVMNITKKKTSENIPLYTKANSFYRRIIKGIIYGDCRSI